MLNDGGDPDAAASRAYHAAFHAVSALFAAEGRSFGKHAAVAAAVHRDLVRSGRVPVEFGAAYTALVDLRSRGDYGGRLHVNSADAEAAIASARTILKTVAPIIGEHCPS
jgi:uncharacterized protein (UPF0332 family)